MDWPPLYRQKTRDVWSANRPPRPLIARRVSYGRGSYSRKQSTARSQRVRAGAAAEICASVRVIRPCRLAMLSVR